MDLALYAIILLLFASFATLHLILCWRLRAFSIWRTWTAFFVFFLAPYWGRKFLLKKLSTAWWISLGLYLIALLAGFQT
jgi:hypothetical protein